MATNLIEVDPESPSSEALDRAEAAIRLGQIVAIPTDALYTLVADPFDLRAVRQVYHAKGRENQQPQPQKEHDKKMVEELVREVTPRFQVLARRFWPGPLTIIMSASPTLPLRATGNNGRLAVRRAKSRHVDELLTRLDQPLIATSANLSGRPTCTSGIEVFGVMDGRVDLVLDGGQCTGVGATTLDITEVDWRLIREGAIQRAEIAECLDSAV